jgi:hypothetical protein
MNIEQIREKVGFEANRPITPKERLIPWVGGLGKNYPIALTLTLKQVMTEVRLNGTVIYRINKDHCRQIAKKFIKKLNREACGNSAKRNHKGLNYIVAVEGNGTSKHYHLHMMIGGIPSHVRFHQMDRLVRNAKSRCEGIDGEYDIQLAGDSGWGEYICKELNKSNTDNILWDLS